MPSRDSDEANEIGNLHNGKRYKLEGRKRNVDGECKKYLESNYNTTLWNDLEDHSDRLKRHETPEKPKTPEVRSVTPPIYRNNTNTAT